MCLLAGSQLSSVSVFLSAGTSSYPTGQMLVKYYIGHFIKFVKKIHVWLKSDKNNETLYGKISTLYIADISCNKTELLEPNYILP